MKDYLYIGAEMVFQEHKIVVPGSLQPCALTLLHKRHAGIRGSVIKRLANHLSGILYHMILSCMLNHVEHVRNIK